MDPINSENEEVEVEVEVEQDDNKQQEPAAEAERTTEASAEEDHEESSTNADDEVEQYSKKVQKRISKLTHKLREAERREQAAIQYAQGVQEQLGQQSNQLQNQVRTKDEALFTQYVKNIDGQLEIAKENYKKAHDVGDVDALMEAQTDLSRYSVEKENLKRVATKRKRSAQQQRPQQQQQQMQQQVPPQTQQAPQAPAPVDEKAQEWAESNEWFGKDEVMTYAAFGIHKKLLEEGVDPTSDLYYNRLNSELKTNFPTKLGNTNIESDAPPKHQQVAGASRTGKATNRGNKVKLTPSEVSIANKLGVPLEQYAKYKKTA